ncbi:MAG: hypothetical protein D6831_01115, partial [Aquificota bacterium]
PVIVLDDLYDVNQHNNLCSMPQPDKKVCFTVRANACCPNTDLELPDLSITEPQCIIDVACQFALNMRPSLSIIDMYPRGLGDVDCSNSNNGIFKCYDTSYEPGTQFVNVGYTRGSTDNIILSDSCTDNDAADGTITIINDNDNRVDDDIVLGRDGWTGEFTASIYDTKGRYDCDNSLPNPKAYKALDFGHNRMYIDNSGSDITNGPNILLNRGRPACSTGTVNVITKDTCNASDYTSTQICINRDDKWVDDVYMGITGNDRLYWVKWGLTEQLVIKKDGVPQFTVKMDENAQCVKFECCYDGKDTPYFKKWEPNGDEAYIPHLLNNGLTYVKVANNSCWDAEVYARVWDEKGHVADNVYLGIVPAHGSAIFWGNQIFSKAKATEPALGGGYGTFSAILTVGAPKRDVEFAAGDSRDGKGKMLPVYDLDGQELYYRNVDFDHDIFEQ